MKRIPRYSPMWKILKGIYSPGRVFSKVIEKTPFAPFWLKCCLDAFKRPHMGYGAVQAALQAKALGFEELSVIEFGVGEGDGLLELESISRQVTENLGIKLSVFGFDLGTGLPTPKDYRDTPYIFKKGLYNMDMNTLLTKLDTATLVLGDVKDTVETFFEVHSPPPVGFISFDLDFYTSTVAAFRIFKTGVIGRFLPRAFCYFDDIVGGDEALHSDFTGELLAIKEFNEENINQKLAKINGLQYKRIAPCFWADQMFVLHLFDHPLYNTYIYPDS